jgi:hypothetical protein
VHNLFLSNISWKLTALYIRACLLLLDILLEAGTESIAFEISLFSSVLWQQKIIVIRNYVMYHFTLKYVFDGEEVFYLCIN